MKHSPLIAGIAFFSLFISSIGGTIAGAQSSGIAAQTGRSDSTSGNGNKDKATYPALSK